MFRPLTLAALLVASAAVAQNVPYNRLSLDGQIGLNNPVNPMAPAYDTPSFGLFTVGLGGRYMLNPRAGLKLSVGYDRMEARESSPEFLTNYFRVSGEGVMNLGHLLQFSQWTDRVGLLFHAGLGYSSMKEKNTDQGWDQMLHGIIGLAPQLRLNNRWSLEVDATVMAHAYQTQTYDFSARNSNRGIDGFLYNLTLGVHYYIGKQDHHADWEPTTDMMEELMKSRMRIEELEQRLKDDDDDGVANYLDREPGTAAGARVDTKGQTIPVAIVIMDADGDGVTDEMDQCPEIRGMVVLKGCPDEDRDGIADHLDRCPQVAGVISNGGCPEIPVQQQKVFEKALKGIQFETGKDVLIASSYAVLNDIVKLMGENPEYMLEISGHTDNQGPVEYNRELSDKRAAAVRNYLVQKGVAAERLISIGKGHTEPVATNETPEGRALNRRVTFVVKW